MSRVTAVSPRWYFSRCSNLGTPSGRVQVHSAGARHTALHKLPMTGLGAEITANGMRRCAGRGKHGFRFRIVHPDSTRPSSALCACGATKKMATGGYSALDTASRDRRLCMGLGEGESGLVANQSRMRRTPTLQTRKASAVGPSAMSRDRIYTLHEVGAGV
jgi:hypothetical protein